MKERILNFIDGRIYLYEVDTDSTLLWFKNKKGEDVCSYNYSANILYTSGWMDLNFINTIPNRKSFLKEAKEILESILHIKAKLIQ